MTHAISKALSSGSSCRRCIFMHSWYSEPQSRTHCPFFLRWTLLLYINPILDNMRKAEKLLETAADDLNYTVVLPAGLMNGKATGNFSAVKCILRAAIGQASLTLNSIRLRLFGNGRILVCRRRQWTNPTS